MNRRFLTHTFEPVFDENSEILILGTFPSVKSREINFYYGHPQNRFWTVLSKILKTDLPESTDEKKRFLLSNRIAVANDFTEILTRAKIKTLYANGKTAERLYNKYVKEKTGRDIVALPSTSPANASFGVERLVNEWKIIGKDLEI